MNTLGRWLRRTMPWRERSHGLNEIQQSPPRRPATTSREATGPWAQRNRHIERIAEIGRQAWQKETGYRQQARVEGTFLRYKRILGGSLRAKAFEAQQREAMVGCTVLNKMLGLGKAQSSAVTV